MFLQQLREIKLLRLHSHLHFELRIAQSLSPVTMYVLISIVTVCNDIILAIRNLLRSLIWPFLCCKFLIYLAIVSRETVSPDSKHPVMDEVDIVTVSNVYWKFLPRNFLTTYRNVCFWVVVIRIIVLSLLYLLVCYTMRQYDCIYPLLEY